ncbi:MAG: DUF2894 domain-containing protein [Halioglobus sp.]
MTELRGEFTSLEADLKDRDPVRLRYIESLLLKAEERGGKLGDILQEKVRTAIGNYREQYSDKAPKETQSLKPNSPLRELNQILDEMRQGEDDPRAAPLEAALRQQELELANNISQQAQPGQKNLPARREELKAARRFHSAMVELNADKVVTQALEEIPEECGPLNPQRLATRSLETMRDLSPHYLSRFVSYIDTLFWLEQAERSKKR